MEIAENVVVHPYARIRADAGRVVIGAGCTIAETAIVGLAEGGGSGGEVVLERGVNVESGAEVQASLVGEGTEIGIQVKIGQGAVIGKVSMKTVYGRMGAASLIYD